MTKRERYLNAMLAKPVDELVWAPNLDYWLYVNTSEGTLPDKYVGMSRNDIVRSIGGYIWNRAGGLKTVHDISVRERHTAEGATLVHEYETPIGTIREVFNESEGKKRSKSLVEHFVKDMDSLKIMKYIVEATHYEADYEATNNALRETGNDGIVLNQYFCVPFIQFAKTDVGYINALYMWNDFKKVIDEYLNLIQLKFLQGYSVLADGPADVIATGDNMDGFMISPDIFSEYAIPFYKEVKKICAAKGKIFEGHWCGRTQILLPMSLGCGLDVLEAIVTRPMADISLCEALDILDGKIVLQGGVPAVLVCDEGGSGNEFERYIKETILPLKKRRGFILGMSDNVPPNADFSRIEAVEELIR